MCRGRSLRKDLASPGVGISRDGRGLLSAKHTAGLRVGLPTQRYVVPPLAARDSGSLRQRLRELTAARPQFGHERLHIFADLGRMAGGAARPSPVQAAGTPGPYESPSQEAHQPAPIPGVDRNGGQYWAMNSVHDQWTKGSKYKVLTVFDNWHRQCVPCRRTMPYGPKCRWSDEPDRARARVASCDNHRSSNEIFIQCAGRLVLAAWRSFIRAAKPKENGFIESFN